MVFSSTSLSSKIVGPKFILSSPSSQPSCVRFRPPSGVSAAYATISERASSGIALQPSPYEVLGIQMSATGQEIKAAYRRLARVVHPDVASSTQKDKSADEFMKIQKAYATLSDPKKRADCDRTLFRRRMRMSSPLSRSAYSTSVIASPGSGFSGYTRRNWETDQCW
ncbi:unnamed protein product [Ilex paraguariensis]|uniref:J domain-containing protein n=1 Tax=Ilex paraguariensis TaxID=185542 RepID=A0ABC8RUU0_9AQUA